LLDGALDDLHARRTGQGIHHELKQARLLEQNSLRMGGELDIFGAWGGKGLIRAIAMTRVGSIDVSEHQLHGSTGEVILKRADDK
jgi:hypothetical protein